MPSNPFDVDAMPMVWFAQVVMRTIDPQMMSNHCCKRKVDATLHLHLHTRLRDSSLQRCRRARLPLVVVLVHQLQLTRWNSDPVQAAGDI